MKRDLDLVRDLLLALEERHSGHIYPAKLKVAGRSGYEVSYHLAILEDAGFVRRPEVTITPGSVVSGRAIQQAGSSIRMTWQGHEFLDTVRDPEIWRKTKAGASKVGSVGVDLLWGLAKEYVRAEIKERLGISLE
ncbi:DUF2513 domain-containing protein [Microvirga sp. VF16]|uniref:DUF2513 domain-containing protein n=1 Tax=Microvirga sp. VF16 TaxID=2807101 RepID=UPI00193D61AC|nr:DUF2513 domain-containing protein [Microvirga sp. VF16]QRM32483.1 DUF2513 domain-containing protein [Microvirga sp. VF16]